MTPNLLPIFKPQRLVISKSTALISDNNKLKRKAHQKPSITNPPTRPEVIHMIKVLITKRNRPRVSTVKGTVKIIINGLMV